MFAIYLLFIEEKKMKKCFLLFCGVQNEESDFFMLRENMMSLTFPLEFKCMCTLELSNYCTCVVRISKQALLPSDYLYLLSPTKTRRINFQALQTVHVRVTAARL